MYRDIVVRSISRYICGITERASAFELNGDAVHLWFGVRCTRRGAKCVCPNLTPESV